MEMDGDDLAVPHKVVVPARFAVLERLLHLPPQSFKLLSMIQVTVNNLTNPVTFSFSFFSSSGLRTSIFTVPIRKLAWAVFMPRHVITDQYKVHNAFYSPSALTPHTLLPPLQGAARRTKRNFRATSKAGSPLCAAALTSLWIALMSTLSWESFTNGSNGGALGTFPQLRDVMLLWHNNGVL